jgi:hypothetical protein
MDEMQFEVLKQASLGTEVEADVIRAALKALLDHASDQELVDIATFAIDKGLGR